MSAVTDYQFYAVIFSSNREAAKQLALLAAPFPNDPGVADSAFETPVPLDPPLYYECVHCTAAFVGALEALMDDAGLDDPRLDYLRQRGLTTQLWAQAKQILRAYWYRLWQEDGTYTHQPDFFEQCVALEGRTLPPDLVE